MKKYCFLVFLLLLGYVATAQNKFKPNEEYTRQSARAYGYYEDKNYLQSALCYDSLFKHNKGEGLMSDRYNAACSWALARNIEKAFSYLTKAVIADKWNNIAHILSDSDLSSLHADKRWLPLMDSVRLNKEKAEASMNKPVMALLDSVYLEDQGDRLNLETIQKQFGWNSEQMDSLWKKIGYQDSVNLLRVKNILDRYGWLGPAEVGQQGALAIFLVIQHADSLTQVTYLPVMREAVKKGKARAQNLALLEDRVLTNQGKEQIYGSQVKLNGQTGKNEFFPIQDEPNVNIRRASVGLPPLEEYAKHFGIEYVLPKSKQ